MNELPVEELEVIVNGDGPAKPSRVSSWEPVDTTAALNGENPEPRPSFLLRSDNQPLIYRGKTHALYAEPEAGKTKLMLQIAKEVLPTGKVVLFDFETTVNEAVQTLLHLGTNPEDIRRNLNYVSPDTPMTEGGRQTVRSGCKRVIEAVNQQGPSRPPSPTGNQRSQRPRHRPLRLRGRRLTQHST